MSTQAPVRLLIHGARGKMGARIAALARADARFNLVAEIDHDDDPAAISDGSINAMVDFSSDAGARQAAQLAVKHRAALLVGTTGLSANSLDAIEQAARSCPVMLAANTSLGVAVLHQLIATAARLLGPAYSIDLIEAHHTAKKDAPSGTALRLIETLQRTAGVDLPKDRVHCLRAGDIVGDHTLQFAGPGEKIIISHSATNRDVFAQGALRAIHWLAAQKPGRYTIEQSLGVGAAVH
jgi:4-hydroxy-tetrahydrodipicolinate reductase